MLPSDGSCPQAQMARALGLDMFWLVDGHVVLIL